MQHAIGQISLITGLGILGAKAMKVELGSFRCICLTEFFSSALMSLSLLLSQQQSLWRAFSVVWLKWNRVGGGFHVGQTPILSIFVGTVSTEFRDKSFSLFLVIGGFSFVKMIVSFSCSVSQLDDNVYIVSSEDTLLTSVTSAHVILLFLLLKK